MSRILKPLILIVILALALVLTRETWLPIPGTYLLVKDNPEKADCIVPLSGDAALRYTKASELYRDGYSKKIIVSVIPEEEKASEEYNFRFRVAGAKDMSGREFAAAAFQYLGVAPEDVHVASIEATSTYDEAVAAKRVLSKKGYKSLILVTNTYHMRRALTIFRAVFRDSGIRIYNSTAPNDLFDPYHWWRRERDVKTVSQEYFSIVYNFIYHFVIKKDRTAFDNA